MKRKSEGISTADTSGRTKMILSQRPELKGELKKLYKWFTEGEYLDINAPKLEESAFYKEIQQVQELNASFLGLPRCVIGMTAYIAAASPMLQVVNISGNGLSNRAPEVAAHFAASDSVYEVDISNNDLKGKNLLATRKVFEDHNQYIYDLSALLLTFIPEINVIGTILVKYIGQHIEFNVTEDAYDSD
jgi:hypothetical protein